MTRFYPCWSCPPARRSWEQTSKCVSGKKMLVQNGPVVTNSIKSPLSTRFKLRNRISSHPYRFIGELVQGW
ncbi:hypothetical protein LINPERHAP1_LOCUS31264 [Linum perenne]